MVIMMHSTCHKRVTKLFCQSCVTSHLWNSVGIYTRTPFLLRPTSSKMTSAGNTVIMQDYKEIIKENDQLKEEIFELKNQLKDKRKLSKMDRDPNPNPQDERLALSTKEMQNVVKHKSETIANLWNKIQLRDDKQKALSTEIATLKKRNEHLTNNLDLQKKDIKQYIDEIYAQNKIVVKMENKICELQKELDRRMQENDSLKVKLATVKANMQLDKNLSEKKLLGFQKERDILKENGIQSEYTISILNKDLKNSEEKLKEFQKNIKHLIKENHKMKISIEEKSAENKDLKESCETFKNELSHVASLPTHPNLLECQRCQTLEENMKRQKYFLDKKENNLKKLLKELDTHKSKQAKLTSELQNLHKYKRKILQLRDKLSSLRGKIVWYEIQHESLAEELQMLKLEKSTSDRRIPPISTKQSNDECDSDCPLMSIGLNCIAAEKTFHLPPLKKIHCSKPIKPNPPL